MERESSAGGGGERDDRAAATEALRRRLVATGLELKGTLASFLEAVNGPGCRPRDVISVLGVDKSMASRVAKAARVEDPLDAFLEAPAPQGIGQLIDRARSKGMPAAVVDRLEECRELLLGLHAEFDNGRSDLEMLIRGLRGEDVETHARAAQHAIFRGMTQLQGCSVERHEVQTWYAPSVEGPEGTADYAWSSAMVGLRRLRDTSPLIIGGVYDRDDPTAVDRRYNLDGQRVGSSLTEWVVEDLSSFGGGVPSIHRWPPAQLMVLEPGVVPLLTPLQAVIAQRTVAGLSRYADEEQPFAQAMLVSRLPSKRSMIDFFVHESLGFGAPECRAVLHVLPLGIRLADPRAEVPDRSDMALTVEALERGTLPESALGEQIAERIAAGASWDIAAFQRWRVTVEHPVPLVTVHSWFSKPARPEAASA
ncbi:MAG: hypothetical protein ACTS22_07920 [Phycisphaerales bacterium]